MRQLKVGHKIKWHLKTVDGFGINTIYTVLAIDTNHQPCVITTPSSTIVIDSQILIQWQQPDGQMVQVWTYNLDEINNLIARGQISILNPEIEPCQHLDKFSFLNQNRPSLNFGNYKI